VGLPKPAPGDIRPSPLPHPGPVSRACIFETRDAALHQTPQRKSGPQAALLETPHARADDHEWNFTTSGTISSATMLMILISGFTAGPAVSL
jgi:hypothetical protein